MAGPMTHALQAWDAARKRGLQYADDHFIQYILGAMGPLPFGFEVTCRRIRTLEQTLHVQKTGACFSAMAAYCRTHPEDQKTYLYCLGYVCHYVTDCVMNPFVDQRSEAYWHALTTAETPRQIRRHKDGRRAEHRRFEAEMDFVIHEHLTDGKSPLTFMVNELLPFFVSDQEVAFPLWETVLRDVYQERITVKQWRAAVDWCQYLLDLAQNRGGAREKAIHRLEVLFCGGRRPLSSRVVPFYESDRDVKNEAHASWQGGSFAPGEQTCGALELYDQAVELSVSLMGAFERAVREGEALDPDQFNCSMETGEPL